MKPPIKPHVITDEDDLAHAELYRQIHGLKPGITAPADDAEPADEKAVSTAIDRDMPNVPRARLNLSILTDFEAVETRRAAMDIPPYEIAGIENIGEGA